MMWERGVDVSHEAIQLWTLKFGGEYARRLRHRRGRCGDTWHLDECFVKIAGEQVYLWRAVDQEDEVRDILVKKRRNAKAAKRFFRKLLKGLRYAPRVIATDKLASYRAAHAEIMPMVGISIAKILALLMCDLCVVCKFCKTTVLWRFCIS